MSLKQVSNFFYNYHASATNKNQISDDTNSPQPMLIDTHCHLTHVQKHYPDLLKDLQLYPHPFTLIDIGCEPNDILYRKEKFGAIPGIQFAMATHPVYCHNWSLANTEQLLKAQAHEYKIIGEIGLDLRPQSAPQNYQRDFFELQLSIAHDSGKPVVIHSRNAVQECIEVLRKTTRRPRGIIHCFSGSLQDAYAFIDLGFLVSFTANITYPKNHDLRSVVRALSLQDFLLETDAPYMPPKAQRGKANHPFLVEELYHFVAALKQVSVQQIKKVAQNQLKLLNIHTI